MVTFQQAIETKAGRPLHVPPFSALELELLSSVAPSGVRSPMATATVLELSISAAVAISTVGYNNKSREPTKPIKVRHAELISVPDIIFEGISFFCSIQIPGILRHFVSTKREISSI